MANVEKLQTALEYVTEHPEEWKQEHWAKRTDCGTACCLAGRVVLQAGYDLKWEEYTDTRLDEATGQWVLFKYFIADDILPHTDYPDGEGIEEVSNNVLDLNHDEGCTLYDSYNKLRDLWETASDITDGEIEVPDRTFPDEVKAASDV